MQNQLQPKGSKYPIILHFGFWVIVIIVQVLGKYNMVVRCLDPLGGPLSKSFSFVQQSPPPAVEGRNHGP